MSDVVNGALFGVRFGTRFLSVSVITKTGIKRAPKRASNRAPFAGVAPVPVPAVPCLTDPCSGASCHYRSDNSSGNQFAGF